MTDSIYQFKATSIDGHEINMDSYRGKVILVVNTASKCGFTPQYEGLEKLYKKYREGGLEILGFPCNQFGNQESGTEEEIAKGCLANYGVSFQVFSKIKVNGSEAHPLYVFLKKKLKGNLGSTIKWNFTKFLIDRKGNPVKRFAPVIAPEKLEEDIKNLLE